MKKILFFGTVFFFASLVSAMDYEPYTYRQNFESGELMAWSSYPPIQDAAYEAPYIYPGAIVPGEEGTVLCKIIFPEWDAPQLTGVAIRSFSTKRRISNFSTLPM